MHNKQVAHQLCETLKTPDPERVFVVESAPKNKCLSQLKTFHMRPWVTGVRCAVESEANASSLTISRRTVPRQTLALNHGCAAKTFSCHWYMRQALGSNPGFLPGLFAPHKWEKQFQAQSLQGFLHVWGRFVVMPRSRHNH